MISIKIINRSQNPLPEYATALSAGMDLKANLKQEVRIAPGDIAIIPTGIFIELPEGYEAQIRPRSGLAAKSGISIPNSPGTIDADYRGEIKVILINLGKEFFVVNHGDRIAQMVVARHETVKWENVTSLNETDRGEGGFGHTGINTQS
ncbi:MAG: dUTP diphosphatase [Bacteroidia bacterium]|nr:dUTP diphosphatase [Bacteroidia bacterium]